MGGGPCNQVTAVLPSKSPMGARPQRVPGPRLPSTVRTVKGKDLDGQPMLTPKSRAMPANPDR
jgi:hypothetical protein